jgi:predicted ABC-type ATPase/Flp pilus assembly protein TadD
MIVVAGPPGSGKSSLFPAAGTGLDSFNADDSAAESNAGSYQNITPEMRIQAAKKLERFIANHVHGRRSFAYETALRTDITFRQADEARAAGFLTVLAFVALDDVELNISRVAVRADRGGHSAPAEEIRRIHSASMKNLGRAIQEFDQVYVFDNSRHDSGPDLVLEAIDGTISFLPDAAPAWLLEILGAPASRERREAPHRKGRAKRKPRPAEKAAVATSKPRPRWWIYALAAAAVAYLAYLVYAPALSGPFVFDDISLPYDTPGFPAPLRFWVSGVRPLLMFSYWVNYQFSQAPNGFHVINFLCHLLNSFLIFLIVRKLLQPDPSRGLLPAFAAAVFLLHPIQTEAVSYIAGRSECLSVLFFLAAFAVFLYRRSAAVSWKIAIAVLVLFGAAAATKEHTLALPALLLLTDYYWNPGFSFSGIRRNWRLYLPIAMGAAAGLAFVARILAHNGSAGFGLKDLTWYQYFFTECRAFFVYLRLLVLPAGQNPDWDYPVSRNIMDHGAIVGLAVILALVAAAIYFRRRYPLASYGFLVYVLLMAPTSSFVPIKDPLAERRLYLPMIGMLLVAVAALARIRVDRRKLTAAFCGIAIVLGVLTYQRNQLWASEIGLWEDAARKSPAKQRVQSQLAHAYFTSGRCSDAITRYAEAARVSAPDYGLLVDWGLAYDCAGQSDAAVAKLRQAASINPTAHVYSQIAMVYAKQSRWPEALEALDQAGKLDSNYDMIYDNRGGIRAKTNDFAGAAEDYRHALALNPSNEHARRMLAIVERRLNSR